MTCWSLLTKLLSNLNLDGSELFVIFGFGETNNGVVEAFGEGLIKGNDPEDILWASLTNPTGHLAICFLKLSVAVTVAQKLRRLIENDRGLIAKGGQTIPSPVIRVSTPTIVTQTSLSVREVPFA